MSETDATANTETPAPPHGTLVTLTAAALLLTFLQLVTAWFENIYRMSLIKLEMGPELAGLLLPLLAPAAAWGIRRAPRLGARLAVLVYLVLYVLVWYPPTTPTATILLAGTGVALALALAAHALAGPHGPRIDGFTTAALATLGLAALRAANNSLDLYAAGSLWGLLPLIALLPLLALHGAQTSEANTPPPRTGTLLPTIGIFGIITFIFLVLSAPADMAAWGSKPDVTAPLILAAAIGFALLERLLSSSQRPTYRLRLLYTAFFCGALAAGIWHGRISFPMRPSEIVTREFHANSTQDLLFFFALVCASALIFNFGALLPALARRNAIRLVSSFLLGIYLVVSIALLVVFTNVWGYVGEIGHLLRNHFEVPFILCGTAVLLPVFLLRKARLTAPWPDKFMGALVIIAATYLFLFTLHETKVQEVSGDILTVLTYNIQQGSREDGDQAYVAQCDFIRRINPDVVALQESDTARPSGGFVNAAQYFAESLGYYYYYGPSTIAGTFGTAILSRFPIRDFATIYTYSDTDEVGTAVVALEIGKRRVRLFNNHPAGSDTVMDAHADMLVKEIQHGGPVIAAGDFNSRPNEAPYKAINAVLHNAWETLHPDNIGSGFSLEKMRPEGEIDMTRRIDHIFYSDDLEVLEAYYVPPPESQTDHPAHWATLRFKNR